MLVNSEMIINLHVTSEVDYGLRIHFYHFLQIIFDIYV